MTKKPEAPLFKGRKISDIERFANMAPMQRLLNDRYGQGQWHKNATDPEGAADRHEKVLALMLEREGNPAVQQAALERKVVDKGRERTRIVEAKAATYRLAFPNVTPNDDVLIFQLAEIEVQLDELTEDQQRAVLSEAGDPITTKAARGKLRLSLVAEHRKIQGELGISRAQRSDEIDAAQILAEYGKAAQKLLAERATPIRCPACFKTHAINQGFILYHFRAHTPWEWRSQCPNPECRHTITITSRGAKSTPYVPIDQENEHALPNPRTDAPDAA